MIWEAKMDGKYDVEVERLDQYTGMLRIKEGDKVLHERTVELYYGALFGPDVEDVELWQQMAVAFVDSIED